MIHSIDYEQHLLAGLMKYPNVYVEVAPFISEQDFYDENSLVNKTIFCVLKQALEAGDSLDEVILAQRVSSLGISFEDNLNVGDYIKALSMRKISEDSVAKTAKELKKISVRRGIYEASINVAKKMKGLPDSTAYDEIINSADQIYNDQINNYQEGTDTPENIFDEMEGMIEERGNNPIDDFGPEGPHRRINDLYGSLLRPGNITVIVARSGVGKTNFCMDFSIKVSGNEENLPVLHFDNGEMSKEELVMRQCAALSGVPLHLLETGKWRRAGEDVVARVRAVWPKVKRLRFYYYNVAGLSVDSMTNIIKRFYYAKVGRGNKMIFSFDYIKTTSEKFSNKNEWQVVGEMVDKFKALVQKEICFEGDPMISMITSVQSNRYGITTNRNASNIVDDESIVSLSDRITQFSSHLFSLRKKTLDEIEEEPEGFGTHKLICFKHRHLGPDVYRALQPVEMPDGSSKQNYLNLNIENFNIEEKGDLKDMVESMVLEDIGLINEGEEGETIPTL
jgi:replicative DNA helicase